MKSHVVIAVEVILTQDTVQRIRNSAMLVARVITSHAVAEPKQDRKVIHRHNSIEK